MRRKKRKRRRKEEREEEEEMKRGEEEEEERGKREITPTSSLILWIIGWINDFKAILEYLYFLWTYANFFNTS